MYTRTEVRCVLCNQTKVEMRPTDNMYVPFTFEDPVLRAILPLFKILLSDLCVKCVMGLPVNKDETKFVLEQDAKVAPRTRRRIFRIVSKRLARIF